MNLLTQVLRGFQVSCYKRKGGKKQFGINNSVSREEFTRAHSHVEEHASSHDEKVSGEEDQAVVYDETVDTSMLMGLVTGTDDEGATSCPTYDDYEDDDTTTPCAPLALSYEVHDTGTYDRQVDGTYAEDAHDDEGILAMSIQHPIPLMTPMMMMRA
jgi:hypothetical protein